jgi:hypothetical protein
MPPLADRPAAYLALERENGELRGEVATLRWQLEKLRKLVYRPGKSDGARSAEMAYPEAARRVSRAGGEANNSWTARSSRLR